MAFGFRCRHDWGRPVVRAPDDQAVSVGVFGLGHAAVVAVRARRNARFTTLSLPVFPLHHQGFDSFPLGPACVACRHVAVWSGQRAAAGLGGWLGGGSAGTCLPPLLFSSITSSLTRGTSSWTSWWTSWGGPLCGFAGFRCSGRFLARDRCFDSRHFLRRSSTSSRDKLCSNQ